VSAIRPVNAAMSALMVFCGFLAGLGLLFIGAFEPALQTFAVVGRVLIHVAVLRLLAHEIEQIRLGGFQILVHLAEGGRHPLLDGPFLLEQRPHPADVLTQP
jgi:hypothetical protein